MVWAGLADCTIIDPAKAAATHHKPTKIWKNRDIWHMFFRNRPRRSGKHHSRPWSFESPPAALWHQPRRFPLVESFWVAFWLLKTLWTTFVVIQNSRWFQWGFPMILWNSWTLTQKIPCATAPRDAIKSVAGLLSAFASFSSLTLVQVPVIKYHHPEFLHLFTIC